MKKLLLILALLVLAPQAHAARIFTSGFETNSVVNGSSEGWLSTGSPTIVTSPVRTGTYALRATALTSATAKFASYNYQSGVSTGPYFTRFYLYVTTLPGVDDEIFAYRNSSATTLLYMSLTSTGTLKWKDAGGTVLGTSAALNTGQWYRIETDMTSGAGVGVTDALLDGSSFAAVTGATYNNPATVVFGGNVNGGSATTVDTEFDDIAINDNTGGSQNSYPGAGSVARITPNATGDANTWGTQVGGTAGAANNFTRVDEVTPDGATSYNSSNTLNQEDLYAVAASGLGSCDTVNLVQYNVVYSQSASASGSTFKVEAEKTSAGTISQGTAITPNFAAGTYKPNSNAAPWLPTLTLYNDPDGSAWTQATIDSQQIGIKLTTNNTALPRVTALWGNVDYNPTACPATNPFQLWVMSLF